MNDRERWNEKYQRGDHVAGQPSALLLGVRDWLPRSGRAVDLAGGAGRHAIWLAEQGLEVTLADVSDAGLAIAAARAAEAGVTLHLVQTDLQSEPAPPGPWDVVVSFHFLWRPLFAEFPKMLAPGGILVYAQPTRSNLSRHDRPPARFLLEDRELPGLLQGLDVLHYEEGWLAEGRHEALLVARRPARLDRSSVHRR